MLLPRRSGWVGSLSFPEPSHRESMLVLPAPKHEACRRSGWNGSTAVLSHSTQMEAGGGWNSSNRGKRTIPPEAEACPIAETARSVPRKRIVRAS